MTIQEFEAALAEIKRAHRYETYLPYLSNEHHARGSELTEMLTEIQAIRTQIAETKIEAGKRHQAAYNEIREYLFAQGLPQYEYTGKKMTKTTPQYLTAIYHALEEKYAVKGEYRITSELSMIEKSIRLTLERTAKEERAKQQIAAESQQYHIILETAKGYLTLAELNAAIALNSTREQLETLIKSRYIESQMGNTIEISCCQKCNEYEIGEHRCSCGNRRISANAEGYYSNNEYQLYIETEAY